MFLTACSYWTYTPFWPFGDSVAIKRLWMMAVSCTKAMLVILFFMHLKWEANWKWILTVPASMMSLLLVLALVPDVGLRFFTTWHSGPSRQRLTYAADAAAPRKKPCGTIARHGRRRADADSAIGRRRTASAGAAD